ncbi:MULTISPECIES: Hsp20/alpha crystallin family protein [unclassified Methanoregula]|uniref:Hsp20/alpha crystallin family protein n=1 Tax=unclassified Methanoregula TaxID=2649730 RepID=UPI0009D0B66A|nr:MULTISPECIES: Hsp20/alpha crystallin family protein [unclassified Methanoregula]OPX63614.1 MAG: Small heat shock protein HSP16.5 [Methanoregula sp. PtaB.Bin085]OPY36220.1 MAG: Small heat shock protein HSP16.5 [Methanoregula sp. PtaU1.Bin006]
MDREKPERKTTDVVPIAPGSSLRPWRMPSLLERDFDSIFDDFRRSFDYMMRPYYPMEMRMQEMGMLPVRYAPLDVIDEGDHYQVHAELPGFVKEDVDVQINSDGLSIRATKKTEKEDKKKNYLHRERAYSAFERSIAFPEEVDPAKAEGKMKEGILELKVPKKEPRPDVKPRKLDLK